MVERDLRGALPKIKALAGMSSGGEEGDATSWKSYCACGNSIA